MNGTLIIQVYRFLSCIRVGEYEGAIENLHRFFDFCLLNRETPLYQYALLNLAILEHKFGHRQKALAVNDIAASSTHTTLLL
jgi:hypothetical protein